MDKCDLLCIMNILCMEKQLLGNGSWNIRAEDFTSNLGLYPKTNQEN